jgi:hypothetical protein
MKTKTENKFDMTFSRDSTFDEVLIFKGYNFPTLCGSAGLITFIKFYKKKC